MKVQIIDQFVLRSVCLWDGMYSSVQSLGVMAACVASECLCGCSDVPLTVITSYEA